MFKKLDEIESRFEELNIRLQDPEVTSDTNKYKALMKEYSDLKEVIDVYREYKNTIKEIEGNKEILDTEKEEEMRSMAKEELRSLEPKKEKFEKELQFLLLPKDPNDDKNVVLEMRAGAGGDEASLFCEELFQAYCNYVKSFGWQVEILSTSEGNAGGLKEVCALISGDKVYSHMKYESGVHRVQRVPKTETQGRVHTSTITVAVIPEAEEIDVNVNPNDVRVDVYRSSGAGGQHVNTTDSAVRLTHIPTGIVVTCQDGKSQYKNKDKAFKVLYARLLQKEEEEQMKEASSERLSQIGTGDRSERIRTYNFPQTRITDHRVGLTTHSLNEVMQGNMDSIIHPVIAHFQTEALKQQAKS